MDKNINIKIEQGDEIMENLISNKLKNKKSFSFKLNKKMAQHQKLCLTQNNYKIK